MKKIAATSVVIAFILIAFMVCGCSVSVQTINVLKSYSGPELPYDQALLLTDPGSTISFLSIDGKDSTDTGIPFKFASGIGLLPGIHNVLVSFKYKQYVHITSSTMEIIEWQSITPKIVRIVVEAGRAYRMNPNDVC